MENLPLTQSLHLHSRPHTIYMLHLIALAADAHACTLQKEGEKKKSMSFPGIEPVTS